MYQLQQGKQSLTIKDIANELNITEQTVYNYVRKGLITPFNKDSWQIDGEYRFNREELDLESLKKQKPGLTTGEVAKELGISATTVLNHIRSGVLKAQQHVYNGRNTYFVSPEELERYKREHPPRKKSSKKHFYSREKQICLYQAFKNPNTKQLARITRIDEDGIYALKEDGEINLLSELTQQGFQPMYFIEEGSYNTKRGYTRFCFIKPANIRSSVYHFIDLVYKYAGPLNIRLNHKQEFIDLEVKPTLLKEI